MNVVMVWSFLLVMVIAGMSLLASSSAVRVPVRVLADLRSRRQLASRRSRR